MSAGLLDHDWLLQLAALIPLLLIGYLSWRHSRRKADPKDLPPMSSQWRQSKDRFKPR